MKYLVTLQGTTYEVEVEQGEAMILDEYEAKAPVPSVAAAPAAAAPAPAAAAPAAPAPSAAIADGTPVTAPLPGSVLSLKVAVGDTVAEGDVVAVIEAMKMENEICAPAAGTVKQILVSASQMVATGDTLMVL